MTTWADVVALADGKPIPILVVKTEREPVPYLIPGSKLSKCARCGATVAYAPSSVDSMAGIEESGGSWELVCEDHLNELG